MQEEPPKKQDILEDEKNSGCVLGLGASVRRGSVYDSLPDAIKEKRRRLENELLGKKNEEEPVSRFASRIRVSKKNPNTPFFKKANTKAYLICALLFAAYIGYNEFLGPDEVTVAFEDLKSRLPLNVDAHTVLEKAYENYEGIFLEIKKSGDEFEQGSDEEKLSHLEDYAKRASSLCKNELFGKYVRSGKVLHVLLKVDEGRLKRTIAIDSCPVPSSPR